jgi:maleamate amidohydrolase
MDAFEAAGYGVGTVGWGQRPAFVVVDFQLAFTSHDYPLGRSDHVAAAVDRAGQVLADARAGGVPVLHTSAAWAHPAEFGRWKIPSLAEVRPESDAARIDPRVWEPTDVLIYKQYPSAFFGTTLVSTLQQLTVDTVLLMGATSSGCVRASVTDAFSFGFRTLVVEDCCGDQDAAAHQTAMRDVGRRYADIVDSAAVSKELSARAS